MSEHEAIQRSGMPNTTSSIVDALQLLGIQEGDTLLVHASLSRLGWVCGGAQAVVQALLQAVGSTGTLVMPAQSADWSDPAGWMHPPVPSHWLETIYAEMPAFDPLLTPTRGMGRIAELFRTFPGTVRSNHPQVSFCAKGPYADRIVADHPLTPQFGDESPLGKLYQLGAKVLLLGVGFDACTSFHLAEARLANMPTERKGTALMDNGAREWKCFVDYAYDADDFARIGECLKNGEGHAGYRQGQVGQASCVSFEIRNGVDYALWWLNHNRHNDN